MARARAADDHKDKALWLTLAQSWVRLAEEVARGAPRASVEKDSEDVVAVQPSSE